MARDVPELPDFHIPLAEKIAWMVETKGYAVEPVPPHTESDPPIPGYLYSIGFPEAFGFPEMVVFGLKPAEASGLVDLVAGLLRGGTQIPIGEQFVGLYDGELRGVLAPIDPEVVASLLPTAAAWRHGAPFAAVQLLWPDRNGFLPTEAGFDRRLVTAQPVVGDVG